MNISNAQQIKGWMSDVELTFLAQIARDSLYILEFGCYYGRSTCALADNTNGIVLAVDPWNGIYYDNNNNPTSLIGPEAFEEFHKNLKDHIEKEKVIVIKSYSDKFWSPLKFDFIFLDGDHRYEEVKKDIEIAKSFIRTNGIIAGHDYTHSDWPGVKKAVDEILGPISLIDSIWYKRII